MEELKLVNTQDGTPTFLNRDVDSYYHSITGAREEAVKKYIKPCGVNTSKAMKITILDVCFGLGYNSAAAIDAFPGEEIEIFAFEKDPVILHAILGIDYPFACKEVMQKLASSVDRGTRTVTLKSHKDGKRIRIQLFLGDVRLTIKQVHSEADVCFFDPFSPHKHPELWSVAVFKDVHDRMCEGGILATYSCARKVRDNMRAAGFDVHDGPSVGRRGPSTLGTVK